MEPAARSGGEAASMRLPLVTRLVFVLYLFAEIALLVLLVQWIGGWPVFLLMLATGFLGGWLIQREGVRAWTAIGDAIRAGRAPARDLAPSRVVLVSGLLLALPGFVSDLLGLLLLLPVTRPLVRRLWVLLIPSPPGMRPGRVERPQAPPPSSGPVIEGEIVDPDDERP